MVLIGRWSLYTGGPQSRFHCKCILHTCTVVLVSGHILEKKKNEIIILLWCRCQGKGKGKGKGKVQGSTTEEKAEGSPDVTEEERVEIHRLRTLDVFAGCGGM